MLKVYTKIRANLNVLRDEDGISAIEYALIAAGIALVVFAAADGVGSDLTSRFGAVATSVSP
mgnify:CR=1 FL=1